MNANDVIIRYGKKPTTIINLRFIDMVFSDVLVASTPARIGAIRETNTPIYKKTSIFLKIGLKAGAFVRIKWNIFEIKRARIRMNVIAAKALPIAAGL